ncbi:MAG: SRPBCC family protein [Candidatus Krumholzibacteriales bacterium]
MTRIERSVMINADIVDLFAYVSDYRYWSDWFEGTSGFRVTSEIERGNGARYRYRVWLFGIPVTVETEIHDYVKNSGWKGVAAGGMPHRTEWMFETEGDSTRFTYALEYRIPVPLLGPVLDSLFMKKKWAGIIEKSLENLKIKFSGA